MLPAIYSSCELVAIVLATEKADNMDEHIIELGLLRRMSDQGDAKAIAVSVSNMLALLPDMTIQSAHLRSTDFRNNIDKLREQLGKVHDSTTLKSIINSCVAVIRDYAGRAQSYLAAQEAEFQQVAQYFAEALKTLASETETFHDRMAASSAGLVRLMELEDIRELKRQMAQGVNELREILAEKKKQDEARQEGMLERIAFFEQRLSQAREEAMLDPLTSTYNRRGVDTALIDFVAKAGDQAATIAMVDVDQFKRINDTHGHQVGDRVLQCVAEWLRKGTRFGDFLGRYGGDEFVILMTDIEPAQAARRLGEIIQSINKSPFKYARSGQTIHVPIAVSCGLAALRAADSTEMLLKRADEALYLAKKSGGNRVITK